MSKQNQKLTKIGGSNKSDRCLGEQVRKSVESYFQELNGEQPCDVYSLVISEVEKPLLEVVMKHIDHNQTKASKILGINRNTLRKKLTQYGMIDAE